MVLMGWVPGSKEAESGLVVLKSNKYVFIIEVITFKRRITNKDSVILHHMEKMQQHTLRRVAFYVGSIRYDWSRHELHGC